MKIIYSLLFTLIFSALSGQNSKLPVPYLKLNGKYCYVNSKMEKLFNNEYDFAGIFTENHAVVSKNGKFGMINILGNSLLPEMFDQVSVMSCGVVVVKDAETKKYGLFDKTGKKILPFEYDRMFDAKENMVRFVKGEFVGYADIRGNIITSNVSEGKNIFDCRDFSYGRAVVKIDSKYGCIDKKGKMVIEPKYDQFGSFSEGLAPVKIGELYGFIDTCGQIILPLKYSYAGPFYNTLSPVRIDDKKFVIDKTGKTIIEDCNCGVFKEGFAIKNISSTGEKKAMWGFIDKSGKAITEFIFEDASDFSDGMAKVKKNGNYGFIDKSGKLIIPAAYQNAENFKNGFALVGDKYPAKKFYIDKTGKEFREK